MKSSQSIVIERLQQAQNAHDLEAFLFCFAPHLQSDHPVQDERAFQGVKHVRQNWSAIFHDIPDFHSEPLRSAVEGNTVWAEWYWFGTCREWHTIWYARSEYSWHTNESDRVGMLLHGTWVSE